MYIVSAAQLDKALVWDDSRDIVAMPRKLLLLIFRAAFAEVFDARWYRATYPDVAEAVDRGEISSELDHFIEGGYWEGRMPCSVAVNEDWYKRHYDDVRAAIEAGDVASAHQHYNRTGYFEGRVPDASAELDLEKWSHALAGALQHDREDA